jgi:hypothetical protein
MDMDMDMDHAVVGCLFVFTPRSETLSNSTQRLTRMPIGRNSEFLLTDLAVTAAAHLC